MKPILEIDNLHVNIDTGRGTVHAVRGATLTLNRGEILAVAGESGSGKTMLCNAIMGLLPKNARITEGAIYARIAEDADGAIHTHNMDADNSSRKAISSFPEDAMRSLRGSFFSMVFQDPMTSLDPTISIEGQIAEAIEIHRPELTKQEVCDRVIELLTLVGIERPEERAKLYPYNFSGGMRQRVVIAIALAAEPEILIADEPTTALDVTIQQQILDLLKKINRELGMSILLVTHDLSVVEKMADRVAIMYEGQFVEVGDTQEIFSNPQHLYTRKLLASAPAPAENSLLADTILEVSHLTQRFKLSRREYITAVDDVSFTLREGEILGIVGESGSGKSTLARCIMRMLKPYDGEISYKGINLLDPKEVKAHWEIATGDIQIVFQDSTSAMNPRMKVADIITEPLKIHRRKTARSSYYEEAVFQLKYVGLEPEYADKHPYELSGGQRQRVAIGRALTMDPGLLIADEPVSSLDVQIQAQVIDLLRHMRDEHGCSMIFITHDLRAARQLCDSIGVMKSGKLVEINRTEEVFRNPQHPYTRQLLEVSRHE